VGERKSRTLMNVIRTPSELGQMSTAYDHMIKELQDATIAAGLHHDVWSSFRGTETRRKYMDVMHRHVTFFGAAISAHFIAMLVCLHRVYEPRRDAPTMPILLDRLELDGVLNEQIIRKLRIAFGRAKPVWDKVSVLRHEVLTHRALGADAEEAFKKSGVKPEELEALVDMTKKLLNELSSVLYGGTHAFDLSAKRDMTALLDALQKK
jgi:hypothetical protein